MTNPLNLLTYLEYQENGGTEIEETFNKWIFDSELAINDYTNGNIKRFKNNLSDFEKEVLKKSITKTVDWWCKHNGVFDDYGMFTSYGFGDFSVEAPRQYEDDPEAHLGAMRVPSIVKIMLKQTRFTYRGHI